MNLLNLLGQVASVLDPEQPQQQVLYDNNGNPFPPGASPDEIVVTDIKPRTSEERYNGQPDAPPNLGNAKVLEEALLANEDTDRVSRQYRKGMFGVKGTLRDVLGLLGDSFLLQGGGDRIYAPQRAREQMGDYATGYTQGPEAADAAVERLTAGGYGAAGLKLREELQNEQLKRAQQQSLDAGRQSLAADRNWGNYKDARNAVSRLFASPAAQANPQAAYAQAELIARKAGVTLEDLGVTPDMTPEERAIYAAGDMTVNQQELLPRKDRQLDISEYNAETSRINATRQRAQHAQTELEYFKEVSQIPEAKRTADEKAWVKKYTSTGRSGGSSRAVPASRDTKGWSVTPRK